MVQDSGQMRRQGAYDFMAYYEFACARQDSVPLAAVKINLDKGMLDLNGDRLKLIDWPPILSSISINKHLNHIAISSTFHANSSLADRDKRYYKSTFRRRIPCIRSKDMTFKLCKAIRECLTISPTLKSLHLIGLPLNERDLITLTKGLAISTSLETLSLKNCPIADKGLEVICQSVKYSTSIRAVDFSGCSLTWSGAEHLGNIIKHQAMQRHGAAWAESLRYRMPRFEGMGGLRRITLNCNILIGDRGAAALAHELAEDLWVKALDLQRCGLSNAGARRLLETLQTNSSLHVLDIRCNPLVDKVLIKTVIEKVLMNAEGHSEEYCWIKPETTESRRVSGPKKRALAITGRGKTMLKIGSLKGTSPGGWSAGGTNQSCSRSHSVPWRAAARAGRQRGLPPGVTVTEQSFQGAAMVKVTMESNSEEDEEEDEDVVVEVEQTQKSLRHRDTVMGQSYDTVLMELKECRLRLAEERRTRLKAESRIMEYELENTRLRDDNRSLSEALAASSSASAPRTFSALEDEAVLESIEKSFNKFHAFLDLLRDAGLGQLASMAGINTSDFQPLGKPQLSSTVGACPLSAGDFRDVLPETVAASVIKMDYTPGRLPDSPVGRSPSPVMTSSHKSRLLDLTFSRSRDLGVGVQQEPHQYFTPDIQRDSGSERSFHSQRSFDNVSFGKPSQTQPIKQKDETSSHRSNSYHGNSSNNSFVYSRASRSNSSHGGSSESVSEIISDKAGSVGSLEDGRGILVMGVASGYQGKGVLRGGL